MRIRNAIAGVTLTAMVGAGGYAGNEYRKFEHAISEVPEAEMPHRVAAGGLLNLVCSANTPDCTKENALAYSADTNYEPLGDQEISSTMYNAVIAREDIRYLVRDIAYDKRALARAGIHNKVGAFLAKHLGKVPGSTQGASTIEMQYASWLYGLPQKNVTMDEKEHEIGVARGMLAGELKQFKDLDPDAALRRVKMNNLHDFLDRVYFGRGATGIKAATKVYFGAEVEPKDLNIGQSTILASLLRAPSLMDDFNNPTDLDNLKGAQLETLKSMEELDPDNKASYQEWEDRTLHPIDAYLKPNPPGPVTIDGLTNVRANSIGAQYAVVFAKAEAEAQLSKVMGKEINLSKDMLGVKVITTIDESVQQKALNAVQSIGYKQGDPEIALVRIAHDGAVQAMIGGRGDSHVNFALAPRQLGSSVKIFLAANALLRGVTLDTVYPEPTTITIKGVNNGKDYTVRGEECAGDSCTIRDFVALSSNIVAAELGVDFGVQDPMNLANNLGLGVNTKNLPFSAVLGTVPASTLNLATSFNALLGNEGRVTPYYSILRIIGIDGKNLYQYSATPGAQIVPPNIARLTAQAGMGVVRYGTAATSVSLDDQNPTGFAGKSGTTEDNADALFTLASCEGTTSVREGNLDNNRSLGSSHFGAVVPGRVVNTFELQLAHDPNCNLG